MTTYKTAPTHKRVRQDACAMLVWRLVKRFSPFVHHRLPNGIQFHIETHSITDRRPARVHIESPERLTVDVVSWYLRCPTCSRQLLKLYRTPGGHWGCRRCLPLQYPVQSERPSYRLLRAIEKIDAQLARRRRRTVKTKRLEAKRAALVQRRLRLFASSPSLLALQRRTSSKLNVDDLL